MRNFLAAVQKIVGVTDLLVEMEPKIYAAAIAKLLRQQHRYTALLAILPQWLAASGAKLHFWADLFATVAADHIGHIRRCTHPRFAPRQSSRDWEFLVFL